MFCWSSIEEYVVKSRTKRVFVIGIGGGGDIVGAIHVYLWLRRLGAEVFLGAIPWERFTIDPIPGPIRLREILNAEILGKFSAKINGNSRAIRGDNVVDFQAACVARKLGISVYVVDGSRGAQGILKGFHELIKMLNIDLIIGVDVGGDVLATTEDAHNLWSPLMDSLALAALAQVTNINTALAIHGISADGELPLSRALERVSQIAKSNGIIEIHGLSKADIPILEEVLKTCYTEASKIPIDVFKGLCGTISIRSGSRIVDASIVQAMTIILDTDIVFKSSPLAKAVAHTSSIEEANEALHRLGLYTELDLEWDLYRLLNQGIEITSAIVLDVHNKGLASIRKKYLAT